MGSLYEVPHRPETICGLVHITDAASHVADPFLCPVLHWVVASTESKCTVMLTLANPAFLAYSNVHGAGSNVRVSACGHRVH